MSQGVDGKPPRFFGRVVAPPTCHEGMGELVDTKRKEEYREKKERLKESVLHPSTLEWSS